MNEDKNIALLKTVKKVPPSPFLYDKIEARINAQVPEEVKGQWVWATSMAFASLLLLNVFFIRNNYSTNSNTNVAIESIVEDMGIQTSNQLYYD